MTNDRLRYFRVLSKRDIQYNYAKECVVNSFPEEVTNNFLSHKYMFMFENNKKGVIEFFLENKNYIATIQKVYSNSDACFPFYQHLYQNQSIVIILTIPICCRSCTCPYTRI